MIKSERVRLMDRSVFLIYGSKRSENLERGIVQLKPFSAERNTNRTLNSELEEIERPMFTHAVRKQIFGRPGTPSEFYYKLIFQTRSSGNMFSSVMEVNVEPAGRKFY